MMSLDQVIALHIEGTSYSLATVLRFTKMRGRFSAIEDYASNVLIAATPKSINSQPVRKRSRRPSMTGE
jgi:hypothetical protein